jgi:hypothetical protein
MSPNFPTPTFLVEYNADGSAILKLRDPVRFEGAEVERLTVPRVTGRHLRAAPFLLDGSAATLGQIVTFANEVVVPAGVLDELDAQVARDVATEVVALMAGKKTRATGERR